MDTSVDLSHLEKTYQDGEIIFCEYETGSTKFYFIKKGEVKLVSMLDGQEHMIDVLQNGVFFGEMAVIESVPRSASAIASGTVSVLEFSKDNFETVILQNPQLSLWLIQTFVNRIIVQQQRLQIYSYDEPIARVIMCLLTLRVLLKTDASANLEKKEYIVQSNPEDISKWVGISAKENKDVLRSLQDDGYISIAEDKILIVDEQGLQRKLTMYKKKTLG